MRSMLVVLAGAVALIGLGSLTRGSQQRAGDFFTSFGIVFAFVVLLVMTLTGCARIDPPLDADYADLRRPHDLHRPDMRSDAGEVEDCPMYVASVYANPRYQAGDSDYDARIKRLPGVACAGEAAMLEAKLGPWDRSAPAPPPGPNYAFVETHTDELQETWFYAAGHLLSILTIDRDQTGCQLTWYGTRLSEWRGASGTSFVCAIPN